MSRREQLLILPAVIMGMLACGTATAAAGDDSDAASTIGLESINARDEGTVVTTVGLSVPLGAPVYLNINVGVDLPSLIIAGAEGYTFLSSDNTTTPTPAQPYHDISSTVSTLALYPSVRLINTHAVTLDAFYGGRIIYLHDSDCIATTVPSTSAQETCSYHDHSQYGGMAGVTLGLAISGSTTFTASAAHFTQGNDNPGNFIGIGWRFSY